MQKPIKGVWVVLALVFFFPAGLVLMWTRSAWGRKVKWAVTGVIGAFVLLSAIGNSSTTDTRNVAAPGTQSKSEKLAVVSAQTPVAPVSPTDTPTSTPSPTPVPHDANGFPENYETVTVSTLAKVPSDYRGKSVYFTCIVGSFPKDSTGDAAAINCLDPNDYSSAVQIDATGWDLTKINQSDTIRVYGTGDGSFTGQNAYGAQVSEAAVFGLYVNDLTSGYDDAQ